MKLDGKTNDELLALRKQIELDPSNRADGVFMYVPSARKKLDAIDRQITYNLAVKRAADGNPVPPHGYSGRQSNRRR